MARREREVERTREAWEWEGCVCAHKDTGIVFFDSAFLVCPACRFVYTLAGVNFRICILL